MAVPIASTEKQVYLDCGEVTQKKSRRELYRNRLQENVGHTGKVDTDSRHSCQRRLAEQRKYHVAGFLSHLGAVLV